MIEVKNLSTYFNKNEILHNLSTSFHENKITAIIGQSGCGKSTFLKSLNRIVEEEGGIVKGDVIVDGISFKNIKKEELRKKIGLVFQEPIAFPLTIEKNLSFVLNYHYKLSRESKRDRIEGVLRRVKLFDEVKDKLKKSAQILSGGQKQRLSIARTLLVNPSVILLDEPCSALDLVNTQAIENLLMEISDNVTIIIVTHNLMQAKRIADQVIFMDAGNIVEEANKKDFFEHARTEIARKQIELI